MNNKNKIIPTEEEMQSWFYLHRNSDAFNVYMMADDPLDPMSESRELNEACFNKAFITLKNALTVIATSEVKSLLKDGDTEIECTEIEDLINGYKYKLEKKTGLKTFRHELSRIRITDNYLNYKWLEHYTYEDYKKIKDPKKINLENWLNSKIAPFLSNWVLHKICVTLQKQIRNQFPSDLNNSKYFETNVDERTKMKPVQIMLSRRNAFREVIPIMNVLDSKKALTSLITKIHEMLEQWKIKHETEFEETLESVKDYLKSKNLILPKNWEEVYLDWFADQISNEKFIKLNGNYPTHSRKIIIKWAVAYTEKINKKLKTSYKLESLEPQKLLQIDLKELFEKTKKSDKWQEIIKKLQEPQNDGTRYIDGNEVWVRKGQGYKRILAGLIYYISITYLKKDLNKNEISAIARNNFKEDLHPNTAQTGKNEVDNFAFDEYFSA